MTLISQAVDHQNISGSEQASRMVKERRVDAGQSESDDCPAHSV
jgi:hypothetical protein